MFNDNPYWWSDKEANEKAAWAAVAIFLGLMVLLSIGWIPSKIGVRGIIGTSLVSYFVLWVVFGIANTQWGHLNLDQIEAKQQRMHAFRQRMVDYEQITGTQYQTYLDSSEEDFQKRLKNDIKPVKKRKRRKKVY